MCEVHLLRPLLLDCHGWYFILLAPPGTRLAKPAYDVTIQTYRKSHTQSFLSPYTATYAFYWLYFLWVIHEIFELWRHKSKWDGTQSSLARHSLCNCSPRLSPLSDGYIHSFIIFCSHWNVIKANTTHSCWSLLLGAIHHWTPFTVTSDTVRIYSHTRLIFISLPVSDCWASPRRSRLWTKLSGYVCSTRRTTPTTSTSRAGASHWKGPPTTLAMARHILLISSTSPTWGTRRQEVTSQARCADHMRRQLHQRPQTNRENMEACVAQCWRDTTPVVIQVSSAYNCFFCENKTIKCQ